VRIAARGNDVAEDANGLLPHAQVANDQCVFFGAPDRMGFRPVLASLVVQLNKRLVNEAVVRNIQAFVQLFDHHKR
jgi:hypothetical protein